MDQWMYILAYKGVKLREQQFKWNWRQLENLSYHSMIKTDTHKNRISDHSVNNVTF